MGINEAFDNGQAKTRAADRYYTLEGRTSLVHGTWFPVSETTSSNYTETAEYGAIFYRVSVEENIH